MSEETVNVFHRWQAKLDAENRQVSFFVSSKYALEEAEIEKVDPEDESQWTLVVVLPFPEENTVVKDDVPVTFAGKPVVFNSEELHKRYIPIDEFVRVITQMMNRINTDLEKVAALEALDSDSEWSLL